MFPKGSPGLLYVHIPFCEVLCPYCSFNRFVFNEIEARAYFESLRSELRLLADKGFDFQSMYIGGGTPTILVDELCNIIKIARQYFHIEEVSCETNPNHLTDAVVKPLEGLVQRMSVGVQTFNDDLLKKLNRYNRFGSGDELFKKIVAYRNAFPTVNVDMMFNFPEQTREMVLNDAEKILQSGVKQATFYPLMSSSEPPEDKNEKQFYDLIRNCLSREYRLSTAWTFSKAEENTLIDEYVVDYPNYIGAGAGAFSYFNGRLHVNFFFLDQYNERLLKGELPILGYTEFSKPARMRYYFMMNLFGGTLVKHEFLNEFQMPVERGLWKEMLFLRGAGAFQENTRERIVLSSKGRYLLMVMMKEFFTSVNWLREQARGNRLILQKV